MKLILIIALLDSTSIWKVELPPVGFHPIRTVGAKKEAKKDYPMVLPKKEDEII